jgi:hypothetical protein
MLYGPSVEVVVSKPPSNNNIQSVNVSVEESIDWVPIAIAVPVLVKSEIRAAAAREGLKISVWGRKALLAALDEGRERRVGDRRKSA